MDSELILLWAPTLLRVQKFNEPNLMNMRAQVPIQSDEYVEFKNNRLKVNNLRKFIDHFRRIYEINLKLIQKNRKIATCNQLDMETLGFWLIMLKNLLQTLF